MPPLEESFYLKILQSAPFGYALHQVVLDENLQPIDYTFLDVNPAFCQLTGLPADQLIGRNITQVLPGIQNEEFHWIQFYGDLARKGGEAQFE